MAPKASETEMTDLAKKGTPGGGENVGSSALDIKEPTEKEKAEAEAKKEEEEIKKELEEGEPEMLVFPWTYHPKRWWTYKVPMFLTLTLVISSAEVFACNYGLSSQACTPMGVIAFVACLFALYQLQKLGTLKKQNEKMKHEMVKLKALMEKYEKENLELRKTLLKLEEQAKVLKDETNTLGIFTSDLTETTQSFEDGVKMFRLERKNLERTFNDIMDVVDTLNMNETELNNRCEVLRRELRKLRAHNRAIAETYNNLVEEHEGVRNTNKEMADQILKFEEMRGKFLSQRDILKSSITNNLKGLNTMMDTYQLLFLQEIAHNTEFMNDGQPGMTPQKFEEFLRRIPAHMRVDERRLVMLFEQLADPQRIICDHEAMEKIIVQIVKANRGDPAAFLSSDVQSEPSGFKEM